MWHHSGSGEWKLVEYHGKHRDEDERVLVPADWMPEKVSDEIPPVDEWEPANPPLIDMVRPQGLLGKYLRGKRKVSPVFAVGVDPWAGAIQLLKTCGVPGWV